MHTKEKVTLQEISVKKYKVAGYLFNEDEKQQAEKIVEVVNNFPKQMVCKECQGRGKLMQAVSFWADNGGDGYKDYYADERHCKNCAGKGFLNREITYK